MGLERGNGGRRAPTLRQNAQKCAQNCNYLQQNAQNMRKNKEKRANSARFCSYYAIYSAFSRFFM
jgi:hypothetical protein